MRVYTYAYTHASFICMSLCAQFACLQPTAPLSPTPSVSAEPPSPKQQLRQRRAGFCSLAELWRLAALSRPEPQCLQRCRNYSDRKYRTPTCTYIQNIHTHIHVWSRHDDQTNIYMYICIYTYTYQNMEYVCIQLVIYLSRKREVHIDKGRATHIDMHRDRDRQR